MHATYLMLTLNTDASPVREIRRNLAGRVIEDHAPCLLVGRRKADRFFPRLRGVDEVSKVAQGLHETTNPLHSRCPPVCRAGV